MSVRRLVFLSTLLLALNWTTTVMAENSGWVDVVRVGQQNHTLRITISNPVGAEIGCENTVLAFPGNAFQNPANKMQLYSAALMAVTTGRQMNFYVTTCNGSSPYFGDSNGFWNIQ